MGKTAYKAKPASYYFRTIIPNERWECAKFPGPDGGDSEIPVETYVLNRYRAGIFCNCPAAASGVGRHANLQECKHSRWHARWLYIQQNNLSPGGAPVFYDSSKDKFYPVKFFNME